MRRQSADDKWGVGLRVKHQKASKALIADPDNDNNPILSTQNSYTEYSLFANWKPYS